MAKATVYATVEYTIKYEVDVPKKYIKNDEVYDYLSDHIIDALESTSGLELDDIEGIEYYEENSLDATIDEYSVDCDDDEEDEFDEFDDLFDE